MNLKYLKDDIPASFVVFLVALPLCLGIAVASGASALSGIISGIIGGIVVGALSGSSLSVSGPAAGLTAIVLSAIESMESYEMFLLAVVVAGVIQVILGGLKAGIIGYYFPNAVIRGMLAAIGLILILKQIPHALGYDEDSIGDMAFAQADDQNTFSEILVAFRYREMGAIIICAVSLGIMILFERPWMKSLALFKILPGALFAVIAGVGINALFLQYFSDLALEPSHLVNMPASDSPTEFFGQFRFPDFSKIYHPQIYITGFTIALIASLESLLSLEATDKLDPMKRVSPPSRELGAQGIGNIAAGMIGGIPLTAVIVRSSANVNSGGKTKLSAVLHGIWLLLSLMFLANVLNLIPLASLAAILLLIGYKLISPQIIKRKFKKGKSQFIPFATTIIAVMFTDLLIGIAIGSVVGIYFVLKSNTVKSVKVSYENDDWLIEFVKDVTFIHKATVLKALNRIPEGANVRIVGDPTNFVDHDILESLQNFLGTSKDRKIDVTVVGIDHDVLMGRANPKL